MENTEEVSELVSPNVCHDDDIEPLSGKPFFHINVTKSQIGWSSKYNLIVPAQFTAMLPDNTVPVILTRGEKSWEMSYQGELARFCKKFDNRWKSFAEDNMLKVGDICVFELMECSDTGLNFKVQVLRGDFPAILLEKQDGTSEKPVIVD